MALEHHIADLAVAVEIQLIKVLQHILTDHFALHMAGHLIIGADKHAFLIAGHHRLIHRAVEEDDRNVLRLGQIDDVLCSIVGAGIHHIHDQGTGAFGDRRGDLLGLGGLVAVGVVILEFQTGVAEELIHGGAHTGDVGVTISIIEHRNLTVA